MDTIITKREFSVKQIISGEGAGDYVLSLDEKTQKIEPRRINALLDMGVKPVFKLTTASGRFIKTTGNHPYLAKSGWRKLVELSVGDEIAVPKNEVMQGLSFKESKENSSNGSYLAYPEDKHPTDNPSFNLSKPFFKTFLSDFQHSLLSAVFNPVENFDERISTFVTKFFPQNLRYRNYSHVSSLCLITRTVYHSLENLSSNAYADVTAPDAGAWYKYSSSESAAGGRVEKYQDLFSTSSNNIVSDILWDNIVSIEYIGEEHVYDIEVEGTHNFIGNVGIGTTSPEAYKLNVNGGDLYVQGQSGDTLNATWNSANTNAVLVLRPSSMNSNYVRILEG